MTQAGLLLCFVWGQDSQVSVTWDNTEEEQEPVLLTFWAGGLGPGRVCYGKYHLKIANFQNSEQY